MIFKKIYWIFILISITSCAQKGVFDIVDKPNDKVGLLFERVVATEKTRIENGWYSGLMPSSTKRMDAYLRTIKSIESYASKWLESTDKFNKIEVKIIFNDGREVNSLYTGIRVVQGYGMGSQLLVRMELLDGKVIKTFTNGAENGNEPKYVTPDMEYIEKAVLGYDRGINRNDYYYPSKTKQSIEKEWDNIK